MTRVLCMHRIHISTHICYIAANSHSGDARAVNRELDSLVQQNVAMIACRAVNTGVIFETGSDNLYVTAASSSLFKLTPIMAS
ncbi:hypothetical protein Tco_0839832 [Tanacetum coccineum]|uniref:Uncharacterized protein n=1 Tax=Tanacetum coccineum TaxID=301880 RepID=A0ABQ4ZSR2_9ASTR